MMRKPSCLISCSHWPPEGSLSVLVGRHGAMNPAGKVRWNMRKQIELGRDDCNSAELAASATLVSWFSSSAPNTLPVLGSYPARDRAAGGWEEGLRDAAPGLHRPPG